MLIYKRLIDLTVVLIFLPIILFLFIIVSIYLSITISTPIFFIQTRRKKANFRLYKFRTMANKIGIKDEKFESERKRVLKSTYFLRLFKLDEIILIFKYYQRRSLFSWSKTSLS